MDKVRLAIVGCGTISQLNAPGYLQHEKCDIVALCDPLTERAAQRAQAWGITPKRYTDYAQVLNDSQVDAVELLTPTHLHAEQIIAGLNAGKHISCQKPIASTMDEVARIARAVAAGDFIDAILEGRQPHMDIDFSTKVLQVALAVYAASASERAVDPTMLT
jgi:predicted dehydrogenase